MWTAFILALLFERFVATAVVTLAWDRPSDGVTVGYVIRHGTQSGNYSDEIDVGFTTQFSVHGLTAGTRYYFTILAYDSAGFRSPPSSEVSGVAGAPAEEFPGPLPPETPLVPILKASVRNGRYIDLSWPSDISADIIAYRISVGSAPNRDDVGIFTTGTTTRFAIGDLPAGRYYVRVQAINTAGAGTSSNEAIVTLTTGRSARDAPRSLRAIVSGLTVALSWQPPTDSLRVDHYVIEMGSNPGASDRGAFETRQRSLVIETLPNTSSYLRVRAVTAGVTGSPSNEVVAVTQLNDRIASCRMPAAEPNMIRGTANGASVELVWAAASGDTPTGYIVEVGSYSGGRDVAVLNVGADTTSHSVSAPNGTRFFRVIAVNDCGPSEPSLELSVPASHRRPVLPGAPGALARQTSPTKVALTWDAPVTGDAPDYYIVEITDWEGNPVATLQTDGDTTFFHYTLPEVVQIVRVRAANAAGIGPAAPPVTIVVPRR